MGRTSEGEKDDDFDDKREKVRGYKFYLIQSMDLSKSWTNLETFKVNDGSKSGADLDSERSKDTYVAGYIVKFMNKRP